MANKKLMIINGPNLNLLGIREKSIYGEMNFEVFLEKLKTKYSRIQIDFFQSNIEGEIIDKLHETGFDYDGILLNAGGYTHTSVAIGDAVKAITAPVIEIHISNIFNREDFRHTSFIAPYAAGSIIGFGLDSYVLGIEKFLLS
jgi:3-dehydroquinate dehydratase II